jgi:hypothetical protein
VTQLAAPIAKHKRAELAVGMATRTSVQSAVTRRIPNGKDGWMPDDCLVYWVLTSEAK